MVLCRQPKYVFQWCRHLRIPPLGLSSCPFSVLTASASVQSDCSSDDEKLNCAPSQHARKRSRTLCSDSVVQTLHCLKRRPAIAFAYFKDTQSIGFNHDFSTYSEMIQILSHSRQGKMLVSLFSELVSSSNASGPEILPLVDHHRRTCATPCSLSFMVDCLIKACITCYDVQATICLFSGICRLELSHLFGLGTCFSNL